jgi:hypothetical protein
MEQSRILGWALTVLLLGLQGTFLYAIGRYVALGNFRFNPFKKGWNYLYPRYGTPTGPVLMDLVRVVLGAAGYSMYLSFGETGLYMQQNVFANGFLHVPYTAFRLVQLPERVTILNYPLMRAGLFTVDNCVELSLDEVSSGKLLEKMALGCSSTPVGST